MRSSKRVVLALVAAMLLICSGVATRGAQQAGSTDQSGDSSSTATKKKSKKKAAVDASQNGADASAGVTLICQHSIHFNADSGAYHKPGTRWYGKTK